MRTHRIVNKLDTHNNIMHVTKKPETIFTKKALISWDHYFSRFA